ncbi:magnesium transporter CorA family protein [Paenibacillus tarimensis]|uniref:magnesium transporter CorA family protein n=1 Tax=Paenibacillus tarimensis TaxID=416012 RepID=UPI001F48516B|nr:magnesium transporter CorA family protein [Paenibacillus tarimensis]MCF2943637.1 magnesium transporter CorA family protein [Paenibacillus tarimensis]
MIHRMLRYREGWEWHMLTHSRTDAAAGSRGGRPDERSAPRPDTALSEGTGGFFPDPGALLEVKRKLPFCSDWLDAAITRTDNHITVTENAEAHPVLHGTLMIQLSDDDEDVMPLHFWLSGSMVITLQTDLRFSIRLQQQPWEDKLERCHNAPEAFSIMLASTLDSFHSGLDKFEKRLGHLEESMRSYNRSDLMETIFARRYELLHWSHHYIAVKELQGALKEAFLNSLPEMPGYLRLHYRLERLGGVISHYADEIDTLISMDEAISSFRGNDIMKTLTIFTVLFMPATIVGALWGMNIDKLPWSSGKWSFVIMCGAILALMLVIYLWLWRKGWTGDILLGRRKKLQAAAGAKTTGKGRRVPAVGADGKEQRLWELNTPAAVHSGPAGKRPAAASLAHPPLEGLPSRKHRKPSVKYEHHAYSEGLAEPASLNRESRLDSDSGKLPLSRSRKTT